MMKHLFLDSETFVKMPTASNLKTFKMRVRVGSLVYLQVVPVLFMCR